MVIGEDSDEENYSQEHKVNVVMAASLKQPVSFTLPVLNPSSVDDLPIFVVL